MEVLTKAYGRIEVDEKQKIVFPNGLYGFENLRDFVFIAAEQEPFFYLQSIEDKDAAFILLDPFALCPEYEADIDNAELAAIGIHTPEDALVLAVVTVQPDGGMTINLQGPIVIGRKSRLGKQAVLSDPRWQTRHKVERAAI